MLVRLLFAGLIACKPSASGDTGAATTTGVGSTTTGSTTVPEFDCAAIPAGPVSSTVLEAPRGHHDLAFTDDDKILGADSIFFGGDLVRVDPQDNVEILVAGMGFTNGMAWLPDGDLAVAAEPTESIVRVDSAGTVSVLAAGVSVYGLILGPDDMLWGADPTGVLRIDPGTGAIETVLASIPVGQPRVIAFNPDSTRLYIGTISGDGSVFYVDLDASYDPVGQPGVLATGVGDGAFHDSLGVDVCGYAYMHDFTNNTLYRISPSGDVSILLETSRVDYGHGIAWGTGTGPWRADAIYMPLPYNNNKVEELVIGVPAVWDGVVINAPQP